jgi:Fur family transcriptional regulator, zinc uptake regulator
MLPRMTETHKDPAAAARGLTPARRRALDILARANRPLGAYEMIELMADGAGKRPAPISVYRALGYLLDNGLAHRLASKNAFVACGHAHGVEEPVIFLICEHCGEVKEATSPALAKELAALAAQAGFQQKSRVVEIAGRCERCAAAGPA